MKKSVIMIGNPFSHLMIITSEFELFEGCGDQITDDDASKSVCGMANASQFDFNNSLAAITLNSFTFSFINSSFFTRLLTFFVCKRHLHDLHALKNSNIG
jgi:hypothetical protein